MPINYCPSCGSGNKYDFQSPRFCSSCGATFNVAVGANPSTPILKKTLRPYQDDDDDAPAVPINIPKKLDVVIEIDPIVRPTIGMIMQGTESQISVEKPGKRISKKVIKERAAAWRTKLQTLKRHEVGGAGE